ncbi:hypothetical protein GV829_03950 [Sphingomonas lacunae]|uniref:AcrB/AcrD/AcrF family protein n=1 Tax=Sphingomonas lacunae TaxID=2698828 RepID=A0A6M4AUH4_9SPHN|nr:hypothetical protein [Sphingomonas lacunae]QJQ31699.1 hypothetical protein GV829_03950 [Sphingomonas lacunae]
MDTERLSWLTPSRVALLLWLLTAGLLLFAQWGDIATLQTNNPDDALRLVQVRDLLGGQSWWDVSQYRINPAGGGGLMHWSRLIDLPLATGIALLSPLTGPDLAERIIACLWPLALLGLLFALLVRCAASLGDQRLTLLVPALAATNYVIIYQFTPLRVDHHNAQVLLSLAIVHLMLRPATALRGMLAGLFAATHLAISLEGLPAVALFAALFALDWAWTDRPGTALRLKAYMVALAGGAIALQTATRGVSSLTESWCDALSLPWLGALGVAALLLATVMPWLPTGAQARWWRIGMLGVAGAASGATLLLIEPGCTAGPFAALDPVVKAYWYDHVREGLPLWNPLDRVSGFAIGPTCVGLIGSIMAWRTASDEESRHRWLIICATLLGTGLLSLMVLRTASTAQMIALPGCAALGLMLWDRARAMTSTVPRIGASLAAFIAVPPLAGMAAAIMISAIAPSSSTAAAGGNGGLGTSCVDPVSVAALNAMPTTTILAPLDIGPDLLQRTPHSVVATGHHRNNAAMAMTINTFIGPADQAQAMARRSAATLIVICPHAPETATFRRVAPDGLAARLSRGEALDGLDPLPLGQGAQLRAWQIKP